MSWLIQEDGPGGLSLQEDDPRHTYKFAILHVNRGTHKGLAVVRVRSSCHQALESGAIKRCEQTRYWGDGAGSG